MCDRRGFPWSSKAATWRVSVRLILGSYRIFWGLSFTGLGIVAGCGNLVGLGGYSVADGGGAQGEAGTGNSAGNRADGGSAGRTADAGSAGEESGMAGALAGSGGTSGASGSAGTGGEPDDACPTSCDDADECTKDNCAAGECVHEAEEKGTPCGTARSCDERAVCVRCLDTVSGTGQDVGCSPTAPVCLGTGLDAACGGCTTAADCDDGNECTSETCTAGKCVFTAIAVGSACSAGVCNGATNTEKCVPCADTGTGVTQDAGCSAGKPLCDTSGATPTCYECLSGADCATDNVACTVETCTNHQCSHAVTDSKCTPSNDVCKPNKCDATADCKQVDISSQSPLVSADSNLGNGGFEVPGPDDDALGWVEASEYYIIYNCSGAGCAGGNGTTYPPALGGNFIAWMGSELDSNVAQLYTFINIPAGATKIQVVVDTNFQTKSAATSNHDYFEVRLLDSDLQQVGSALSALSNVNAQTGTLRNWTKDAINVSRDVTALAGKKVALLFWASTDTTLRSDFFFDNVRVTATVCK